MHTNPKLHSKSDSLPLWIAMAVIAALAFAVQASAQHVALINVTKGTGTMPAAGTGAWQGTVPWYINLEGTVSGFYIDGSYLYHGFLRTPDGKIITFDAPGAGTISPGAGTAAYGINIWGTITGNVTEDSYATHGFVRAPNGTMATFDAPNAYPYYGTYPEAINDRGEVVGWFWNSNGVAHGFLRSPEGNFTTFDAPDAGTIAMAYQGTFVNYANSINNAGEVVGYIHDKNNYGRAWLRTPDGNITTFDAPLSAQNEYFDQGSMTQGSGSQSVNSVGDIIGWTIDKYGVWHGFLRTPQGKMSTFDAPGASTAPGGGTPWGWGTVAQNINDLGEIVGSFTDANDIFHVFVRTANGNYTTFEDPGAGTINTGVPPQGTFAFNNNLGGVVTGWYLDSDNVYHGYLRY
jgi:probable HAF family extracellular repeat protein